MIVSIPLTGLGFPPPALGFGVCGTAPSPTPPASVTVTSPPLGPSEELASIGSVEPPEPPEATPAPPLVPAPLPLPPPPLPAPPLPALAPPLPPLVPAPPLVTFLGEALQPAAKTTHKLTTHRLIRLMTLRITTPDGGGLLSSSPAPR